LVNAEEISFHLIGYTSSIHIKAMKIVKMEETKEGLSSKKPIKYIRLYNIPPPTHLYGWGGGNIDTMYVDPIG
jgi:hypothetical protein